MFLQHASYGTRQVCTASCFAAPKSHHQALRLICVCLYTAAGDPARQSELCEGKRRFSSMFYSLTALRTTFASWVNASAQVFKDSQLMDKKLSVTDLDIIFSKVWLRCTWCLLLHRYLRHLRPDMIGIKCR